MLLPPGESMRGFVGALIVLGAVPLFMQGGFAQDSKKIQAGESVYNNYCFTCHGEKLVSSGQTFDLRRLHTEDRARFENSVNNGKGQMPPWKGVLTNEEIDQLWHYIRANAYDK
jgi:mono/diheme cytochrome c family protein